MSLSSLDITLLGKKFNVTHHIDQFRHQDPGFLVLCPYPVDPDTE
jgi:hypothetical protein